MKKKIIVLNFLMSLIVLSAMLFQTLHSYEHVFKQLTEKHCEHKGTIGQKQITHSHTSADTNCHICHFAFSTFIPSTFQALSFHKAAFETSFAFFYTKASISFFKGSLRSLRGPPSLL